MIICHPSSNNKKEAQAASFFCPHNCKKLHKFAQFLKRRFCYATPVLAGRGRPAQSAQKEACLARRRGGGASARFGGREGVGIPRQKPSAGRALSRCIRRARRQKPARMALAASGWGYDVRCCGLADTAGNGGAAGRYRTAGNGGAAWCYCATSSRA